MSPVPFSAKPKAALFLFAAVLLACSPCAVGLQAGASAMAAETEGTWDPVRYIGVDEIEPGMEAYCLTCYKGTEVEKFALEVLSVARGIMPGRDAILIQGTDDRLIHTGPVWGCSGSPVFIDGRLAGAMSIAWYYSKDPLYGVTPIREMLRVSRAGDTLKDAGSRRPGLAFDFTRPIDFAEVQRRSMRVLSPQRGSSNGMSALPCPLIVSGLPAGSLEGLDKALGPFGFMVVGGITGGAGGEENADVKLVPGGCLVVPLVTGDISMEVLGTVTEVVGDQVYGFGHSFLGYGPVELPMATGKVHTVVSSVQRSFKLGSSLEVVGALTMDESTAVFGRIGAEARMIPLRISVDRYNDPETRVYDCRVVDHRVLTASMLSAAVSGAALSRGDFPPDHTVEYKGTIGLEKGGKISYENISTQDELTEMLTEISSAVALLMNNPFEQVRVTSLDCELRVLPESAVSHIWSVDLSDAEVEAGEQVYIEVVVESVLKDKKKYRCSLRIPEDLKPGKYALTVCGSGGYGQFLRKVVPHRFVARNLNELIEAERRLLGIGRDKLYVLLTLPAGGVTVESAELPDLPATKALILQSAKRALVSRPYRHWLEETVRTGTVITDKKVMTIVVEN